MLLQQIPTDLVTILPWKNLEIFALKNPVWLNTNKACHPLHATENVDFVA